MQGRLDDETIVDAGQAYTQCTSFHPLFNDAAHIPQSDYDIVSPHLLEDRCPPCYQ
jgi:hypothetical protein